MSSIKATSTVVGGVALTGDLGGTASAPTTPTAVHLTGNETINGTKMFISPLTTFQGNAEIKDAATSTKSYRMRTSGSALDFDASGADMYLSVYQNANYTGTQFTQIVFSHDGGPVNVRRDMTVDGVSLLNGGEGHSYRTTTADLTIQNNDYLIVCNNTTPITITLPNSSGMNRRSFMVKRAGTADVTIATLGGTIDGGSMVLTNPNQSAEFMSLNGGIWYVIGGHRSILTGTTTVTAATTLDSTAQFWRSNSTANLTHTLPSAVSYPDREYIIKNVNTGMVTIATTSSQTIDGAATFPLNTQYKSVRLRSNGTNWDVVGAY